MILTLGAFRNVAVLSGRVQIKVFKSFSEPGETEGLLALRRNVANLFELPVLFHVLMLLVFFGGLFLARAAWTLANLEVVPRAPVPA